jgi:hypothetical protein
MQKISYFNLTNFFEKKVTEYQRPTGDVEFVNTDDMNDGELV